MSNHAVDQQANAEAGIIEELADLAVDKFNESEKHATLDAMFYWLDQIIEEEGTPLTHRNAHRVVVAALDMARLRIEKLRADEVRARDAAPEKCATEHCGAGELDFQRVAGGWKCRGCGCIA